MPVFKKIAHQDPQVNRMQDFIEDSLNPLLKDPESQNVYLKNIDLIVGQDNIIPHKLGRAYQGWILTDLNSNAQIWSTSNNSPTLNLVLRTSTSCTVSIKVF